MCDKLFQLKEDKLRSSEYVKINEEKRVTNNSTLIINKAFI